MILSDPRFAAAYRTQDGEALVFDDIGDMVVHGVEAGELDGERTWVHDYESEEWVVAATATYVRGRVETPMGRGLVAFAKMGDADAFANRVDGEVLVWDEVVGLARHGALEPDPAMAGTGGG